MKTKVYRIFVVLLLFALIFLPSNGEVIPGYAQSDDGCSSCEQGIHDILPISSDDLRIINLRKLPQISAVIKNYGDLVWNEATIQWVDKDKWQILAVPIKNDGGTETQILLAATQDNKDFRVLVFGMTVENPYSPKFNGVFKFYSPEGGLSLGVIYVDGKLQEIEKGNTPKGLNWSCFVDCLGTLGLEFLPACTTTFCTFCFGLPNPYNPGCWGCAACIGGTAFTCIIACWV